MATSLELAMSAVRAGRKEEGRQLLNLLIQENPNNEMAWLWMSSVVDTDEQRARCLYHVLAINPDHELARRGLGKLGIVVSDSRPVRVPRDSQPIKIPKPSPPDQSQPLPPIPQSQPVPAVRRPAQLDAQAIVDDLPFTPIKTPLSASQPKRISSSVIRPLSTDELKSPVQKVETAAASEPEPVQPPAAETTSKNGSKPAPVEEVATLPLPDFPPPAGDPEPIPVLPASTLPETQKLPELPPQAKSQAKPASPAPVTTAQPRSAEQNPPANPPRPLEPTLVVPTNTPTDSDSGPQAPVPAANQTNSASEPEPVQTAPQHQGQPVHDSNPVEPLSGQQSGQGQPLVHDSNPVQPYQIGSQPGQAGSPDSQPVHPVQPSPYPSQASPFPPLTYQDTRPSQPVPVMPANQSSSPHSQPTAYYYPAQYPAQPMPGIHGQATMGMPLSQGQGYSQSMMPVHSNPTMGMPLPGYATGQMNGQVPAIHSNSTMMMPVNNQAQFQPGMAQGVPTNQQQFDQELIAALRASASHQKVRRPDEIEDEDDEQVNILAVIIFGSLSVTALGGLGMLILLMFTTG